MGRRGLYPQILNGAKSKSLRKLEHWFFIIWVLLRNSETLASDGRPHLLPLEQNCSTTGPFKKETVVGSQPKAHCFPYISEILTFGGQCLT